MPVQFTKPQPNPATAERIAVAMAAMTALGRALAGIAPAAQKASEEMGRSLAQARAQRRA